MDLLDLETLIPTYTSGFLATSVNDIPEVRGWQYLYLKDGKFYFTTSSEKDVYTQMLKNPNASFICFVNDYTFRISGKVEFIQDRLIMQEVFDKASDEVKKMYSDIDSNGYTAFSISDGIIKYAKGYDKFNSFKY